VGEGYDKKGLHGQWGQPELCGGLHLTPVGTTRSLNPPGSAALHPGTGPALRSGLQERCFYLACGWLFSVQGH
jgi:hypothetical protein